MYSASLWTTVSFHIKCHNDQKYSRGWAVEPGDHSYEDIELGIRGIVAREAVPQGLAGGITQTLFNLDGFLLVYPNKQLLLMPTWTNVIVRGLLVWVTRDSLYFFPRKFGVWAKYLEAKSHCEVTTRSKRHQGKQPLYQAQQSPGLLQGFNI